MTKWVYTFGDGKAEGRRQARFARWQGRELAEMSALGLPVPPGITITTEVCTYYYDNGRTYPGRAAGQVAAALAEIGGRPAAASATPKPLLVSVRSGARASMPGMMDTVLNLGLNDGRWTRWPRADERFAFDSYRRFIQMYSDVVLGLDHDVFEEILEDYKDKHGHELDTDCRRDCATHRPLQGDGRGTRQAVPAGSEGAALGRDRRGVQFVDEPACHHLSPAARYPGDLGHSGQRPGDGVRQHGRDVGNRRRLHPQSVDR